MKPEDLRIGNVVYQGEFGPQPIKPIDLYLFSRYIDGEPESINYAKWQPIPLSEDWLKKFGFEKDDIGVGAFHKEFKSWHYQIEKHPGYPDGYVFFIDIDGVAAPPSVRIKYVHQIQNLYFDLTGEEPMIK